MARLDSARTFATDEDLLIAASGDFRELVPLSARVAHGTTGLFAAQAGGSWDLKGDTVNFSDRNVRPGMVCQLLKPTTAFKSPDLLVVEAVDGPTLTLRRAAFEPGVGEPPGPAAGLSGVEFLVASLWSQIERASYDLGRDFGLDENVMGRRFVDLYDPRELQAACVALVLARQYLAMARMAGKDEDFTAKSRLYQADYDRAMARAVVSLQNAQQAGASRLNRQARVVR